MTQELIKDTDAIIVKGSSTEEAGVISGTDIAGAYRKMFA